MTKPSFTVTAKDLNLPNLNGFERTFWKDIALIVEGGIIDNILRQKEADGSPLKQNEPATLRAKAAKGLGQRSLIAEQHRFIQGAQGSWKVQKFLPRGAGVVVVAATSELKKLVQYVGKKGYSGYIGISRETSAALAVLVKKELIRLFRKAGARKK